MTVAIRDWRNCPPGRAKYQLYLASREWAVKRGQVHARSGGTCERCRNAPGENVHHQTYERQYDEPLDDLVHLCRPCHEFVSGKRNDDPLMAAPVRLRDGTIINSVYLAGKITGDNWRDEIAPGWSNENHGLRGDAVYGDNGDWRTVYKAVSVPDGRKLNMTGPWWMLTDANG